MTSVNFAYWLQGMFELTQPKTLNEEQTALIRQHLNMVFFHEIDPGLGNEQHLAALQAIHGGPKVDTGKLPPVDQQRERSWHQDRGILIKC